MKGPHRAPLKWTCKETCVFKRYDGVQVHVLSYLGERWGMGAPRFSTEDLGGSMLTFPAVPGETVVVVPEGSRPQPKKIL